MKGRVERLTRWIFLLVLLNAWNRGTALILICIQEPDERDLAGSVIPTLDDLYDAVPHFNVRLRVGTSARE